MTTKTIWFHGYNHYGFDMAMTMAQIVDAGHKNEKVIIDFMTEPFDIREIEWKDTKFLDILKNICLINDWPQEKFKLISYNLSQPQDTWPNMERTIDTQAFTFLEDGAKKYDLVKKIKKHFGIFINNSSWPRLWLSSYIYERYRDQASQTFVRKLSNPSHAGNLDLDALVFNFSQEGFIKKLDLKPVANFLENIPMTHSNIDLDDINVGHFSTEYHVDSDMSPANDDILKRYQTIFLDIVCQTMFSGEIFSIDEKIARCLYTKTPFIIFGGQGAIKKLQKLGFRSFGKWWNEGYDDAPGVNRLLQIAKVIDEISKLPLSKLEEMYQQMTEVLDHNHMLYRDLCGRKDLKEFITNQLKEENNG